MSARYGGSFSGGFFLAFFILALPFDGRGYPYHMPVSPRSPQPRREPDQAGGLKFDGFQFFLEISQLTSKFRQRCGLFGPFGR